MEQEHQAEIFQLPPGQNYQIKCSCGAESGVLLSKKLSLVKTVLAEHEATGQPLPSKGIHILPVAPVGLRTRPGC